MKTLSANDPALQHTGAMELEQTENGFVPRRLPAWTRPQIPAFMEVMVTQPSGVRIEFTTDSDVLELIVLQTRVKLSSRAPRPAAYDLIVNGELASSQVSEAGNLLLVDLQRPGHPELQAGKPNVVRFESHPAGTKHCEIWLPSNTMVELRGLRVADAASVTPPPDDNRPLWVHYGSSISHCSEAAQPTSTWPAVAARIGGVRLHNLGFGGNCQLDPFVARTIRDLPADLISIKVGINIVNMDSMRERIFAPALHGFIDTIRERHPDTPILLASPIFCPSAETRPGPTLPDDAGKFVTFDGNDGLRAGCLTLTWIRKIISRLVANRRAAGDRHLHYLDGLTLFGAADAPDLPDDLHPNTAGYIRMGERFAALAFSEAGPLARPASPNRAPAH